jgi:peptide/nickel transport system permease protein
VTSPYQIPEVARPPADERPVPPETGSRRAWVPRSVVVVGRAFRTLWASGKARIGLVLLGLMVLVAIFAPLIAPYSPTRSDFAPGLPCSRDHLLGTTGSGQDVFSQLVYGARVSLVVAFAAATLASLIAVGVGMLAGYLRGFADESLSFVTNLALIIPALPLMIVIAAYIPSRGIGAIVLVLVVTGWATGARVMRSQTQSLRNRDFVASALFSGDRLPRIVFREILPNMTSLIAASFLRRRGRGRAERGGPRVPRPRQPEHDQPGGRCCTGRRTTARCSPGSGSRSSRPGSASRCSPRRSR